MSDDRWEFKSAHSRPQSPSFLGYKLSRVALGTRMKSARKELNVPSGSQFSLIGQLGFRSGPHRHGVTLVSSRCFFSKSVWWNRFVTRPTCRYVRSRKTSWFDEVIGLERLTSCQLGIGNKTSLLLFIYFFCVWRSFNLMRTETGRYQI